MKPGVAKLGSAKVGIHEIGSGEIRTLQVCVDQKRACRLGMAEIETSQRGTLHQVELGFGAFHQLGSLLELFLGSLRDTGPTRGLS